SAGIGEVGVGVAVTVASLANQLTASISASSVVSARRDVVVHADANWLLDSFTAAFAGGLFAAINGAVAGTRVGGNPDPGGASEASHMQADTNNQISMSSGARSLNLKDSVAQRAKSLTATNQFTINDDLQTAPLTAGTTAALGNGAVVSAGNDLRVLGES